jgi:uncharacterized membrane protein YkgB
MIGYIAVVVAVVFAAELVSSKSGLIVGFLAASALSLWMSFTGLTSPSSASHDRALPEIHTPDTPTAFAAR